MIIKYSYYPEKDLFLDAYSFNPVEFIPLENVLLISVTKYSKEYIANDLQNRKGIRFGIQNKLIEKLESYLKIKFYINRIESFEIGDSYKCKELSLSGDAKGCKTFFAEDIDRAKVKCSMKIAPDNNWFSGEAEEGKCDEKKKWF